MTYNICLPATATTVRQARRFVEQVFPSTASNRLDDARLLVSELVTNSVMRALSPVELRVTPGWNAVRVEVSDHSRHVPVVVEAAPTSERGRGMAIVDRVADRWGVEQTEDNGKTVWFELRTRPAGAAPIPGRRAPVPGRRAPGEPAGAGRSDGPSPP